MAGVRWSRKAAEQGDAKAQYSLGASCANGLGVPQDDPEAVPWHGKGAASSHARWLFRDGPLAGWTSIAVILLGLTILVPQRRWERAGWLQNALFSALCAAMLAHQLLLSPPSLAMLGRGLVGTLY